MKKNQKGITIVLLVITIVILVIIAGITIYIGNGIMKQASLQTISTNMMLIQAKTKTIAEQAKFNNDISKESDTQNDEEIYKGILVSDISGNKKIDKLINDGIIEDASKYYLLTKEDLSGMGLDKISIDDGYIVSYDTEEIIYVRGFESEGKTYYKLSETKDLNFKD